MPRGSDRLERRASHRRDRTSVRVPIQGDSDRCAHCAEHDFGVEGQRHETHRPLSDDSGRESLRAHGSGPFQLKASSSARGSFRGEEPGIWTRGRSVAQPPVWSTKWNHRSPTGSGKPTSFQVWQRRLRNARSRQRKAGNQEPAGKPAPSKRSGGDDGARWCALDAALPGARHETPLAPRQHVKGPFKVAGTRRL